MEEKKTRNSPSKKIEVLETKLDEIVETVAKLFDFVEKLEKKIGEVDSRKVTVSANGQPEITPDDALLGKEVVFDNFGPVPRDGNGNPLNQPVQDMSKMRLIDNGSGAMIVDIDETDKSNEEIILD